MTTRYYQSRLITLLVLILSIAGCQAENDNMLSASEDYMAFSVDLGDLSLDTRAKSRSDDSDDLGFEWVDLTGEEKKEFQISSLNTVVVFFDEDGKYILHTSKGISTTNLLFSSRSFYFSLSLAQFERLQSIGKVKMTVVANFEESLLETIFGSFWENLETYEDLETKVVSTRFNDLGYPGALLMDGSTYVDFSPLKFTDKRTNLNVQLRLKRAASKIRLLVNYQSLHSKGEYIGLRYRVTEIKAKLTYFQSQTALVGGFNGKAKITPNISVSDWLDLDHVVSKFPGYDAETAEDEIFHTTKYPMFSYEIPSQVDVGLRPFILLRLKIDDMKELKSAYYLYKVPFSVSIMSKFILERNKYYFIRANIGDLGALDTSLPEEPIEVPVVIVPEISVLDSWSENIVIERPEIEIESEKKLKLPEREITLYDELSYDIPYESDTEIEAKIERVEYYKYSMTDAPEYVSENTGNNIWGQIVSITDNKIKFNVPSFLPKHTPITYHIKVSHKVNKQAKPVEQWVKLVYYPAYTVRIKKSNGFYVNERDDFRFHDALGIYNLSLSTYKPNNNLIRITTNVHTKSSDGKVTYIGDPTDEKGRTKTDSNSNQLISPDFIISSDRGITPDLKQNEPITGNGAIGYWERVEVNSSRNLFAPNYGPLDRYGVTSGAYYRGQTYTSDGKAYKTNQSVYLYGGSARDRCYNYFEDDYGPHTKIEEHFLHSNGGRSMSKNIDIEPKYEGRWRLPTTAELMLIREFYSDYSGPTPRFLPYTYYWSAENNTIIPFDSNSNDRPDVARVICVFDVWKLKNHNEKDYEK